MRLLALVASGLLAAPAMTACSLFVAFGEECDDDDGCPSGQVCSEQVCVLRCGDEVACPEGASCDVGTGRCLVAGESPDDPAGDPDAIEVTLAASPPVVDAGSPVELSWTSTPPATDCTLAVKTIFDAAYGPVSDAPLGDSGFFTVYPEQDLEYRVSCAKGRASGSAARGVDVAAAGTLEASPAQLNAGEASQLAWTTNGVAACTLEGPGPLAFAIPASATVSGTTPVTQPQTGAYRLLCDGAELASATLEVARVEIESVSPGALGPGDTEVTLTYSYTGPDAGSCVVAADGVPLPASPPVVETLLSATTLLAVQCDGYGGGSVDASVEVPRLITSFTGPASPVPYGTSAELLWEVADSVSCELDGEAAASPHPRTFTASATSVLRCAQGEKEATAEVFVQVLPAFVGAEVVGGLWKADGAAATSEAAVLIVASTTKNAAACTADGDELVLAEEGPTEDVWHLLIERGAVAEPGLAAGPAADGPQTYQVSCTSDAAGEVVSDELVAAWWGDLPTDSFAAFAASGATLVTKGVHVIGDDPPTSDLAALREVGAHLRVQETSGVQDLVGVERLTRVLGRLQLFGNASLRRTFDVDTGFVALRFVGDGLHIGSSSDPNPLLIDATFPALEEIRGSLEISSNAALTTLSMPMLSSISRGFSVVENRTEAGQLALLTVDLRSLGSVGVEGGSFVLLHTLSPAFSGVSPLGHRPFGSLASVGTGVALEKFEVRHNPDMPCGEVLDLYCALSPRPGDYSENNNAGTCEQACP